MSIEDEVALKRRARERGLLVMGPDCGTGSIRGLPLAFANVVHEGSIGLVGASGTGLQEIMVQIDRLGGGVSHAIGLGGRDLSAEVGGITCLQALRALDADAATDAVVLVSKPPAAGVRDEVIGVAGTLSTPVVAILLGERPAGGGRRQRPPRADAGGGGEGGRGAGRNPGLPPGGASPRAAVDQGSLHGRIPGRRRPAWCSTARSDSASDAEHPAGYLFRSGGHEVIDLGDDAYTRGRPHPMIDPSVRAERIPAVFDDPENAVLLLDVVLGHGSDPDPAGALAPVIADGLARLHAEGRDLAVVASVCGTEGDPQSLSAQTRTLEQAGVAVLPSNVAAVRHALAILPAARGSRGSPRPTRPSRSAACCRSRRGSSTSACAHSPRRCTSAVRTSCTTTGARSPAAIRRLQSLIDALK